MKFAILSMQRVVNFGSVLQAYSLREMIREVTGGTVEFLDIEDFPCLCSKKTLKESIDYEVPAEYPTGILQKLKRKVISKLSAYNKRLIKAFMMQELGLTTGNNKKFDVVIVGSDEVFNHSHEIRLQLHGDVKQSEKVISYAASCGSAVVEDIQECDIERVKDAMRHFSAMSVRDHATEKYVSALYNGNIEHHLDPVLVGDLYKKEHKPVRLKKYLLVYAYGQRIRTREEIDAIKTFANEKGLKIVAMGGSQFWCDLYIPTSPFRVLDYFFYADYVLTDTFHGIIFSVINKKKFGVFVRPTNRNKIMGLLQDLGLQNRIIKKISQLQNVVVEEIPYDEVEIILARERKRSREYLQCQLGG